MPGIELAPTNVIRATVPEADSSAPSSAPLPTPASAPPATPAAPPGLDVLSRGASSTPAPGAEVPRTTHDALAGPASVPTGLGAIREGWNAAVRHSAALSSTPLDVSHPRQMLDDMTQALDALPATGSTPEQRAAGVLSHCSCAAILGGSALMGPEAMAEGFNRLANFSEQWRPSGGSFSAPRARHRSAILRQLAARAERGQLTYGDMQRGQQLLYEIAEAYDSERGEDTTGVGQPTVAVFRQVMWGDDRPSLDGKPLELHVIHFEGGSGHCVLGSAGRTTYDPFPRADGTAYVRGLDEGDPLTGFEDRPVPIDDTDKYSADELRDLNAEAERLSGPRS